MLVCIDTSPFSAANSVRGVGNYTTVLRQALQTYEPMIELVDYAEQADIVHYPFFDFYFTTLPLHKKKPTIVTVHDVIPLIFKEHYPAGIRGRFKFYYQQLALKSVAKVITVSEISKRDIINYLNVPEGKIDVTLLAVPESYKPLSNQETDTIRQRYQLPERFLLYVGDVNYNKNIPGLVRAFSKIDDKTVPLVLVGKAFLHEALSEVQQINQTISDTGIDNRVRKLGYIPEEDMSALFNAATIYIQPSFYEGFGLPVLQAMACGTSVICANAGSLPEIGGQAVEYFEPNLPNELVKQINDLLHDTTKLHRLEEAGIQQAKQFSLQRLASDTAAAYKKTAQK